MTVYISRDDSAALAHYGVKGMKWGVRKDREKHLHPGNNPNLKRLNNYKGKAYFISESNLNGQTLRPRVPNNFMTKNGYEDAITERISFAPSVNQCLMGLSQNNTNKIFYVYEPSEKNHIFYKPNKKAVPDSILTNELWICEPVKLKKVGKIKCSGDSGLPGKRYSYGKHTAELYDWDYDWIK